MYGAWAAVRHTLPIIQNPAGTHQIGAGLADVVEEAGQDLHRVGAVPEDDEVVEEDRVGAQVHAALHEDAQLLLGVAAVGEAAGVAGAKVDGGDAVRVGAEVGVQHFDGDVEEVELVVAEGNVDLEREGLVVVVQQLLAQVDGLRGRRTGRMSAYCPEPEASRRSERTAWCLRRRSMAEARHSLSTGPSSSRSW